MRKEDIKNFINYIIIFTIFSGGLTFANVFSFGEFRIIYILLPLILLAWIPFLENTYFDRSFLWFYTIFVIIIISSIINVFLGNNTFSLLSKQIVGILLTSLSFFLLFKINDYDVRKIFKIYLNLAFLVAFIGLVQVLSFLLNFKAGYDFSYFLPSWHLALSQTGFLRINSILPEPAAFCYVMMPAFFVSIASLIKRKYALLKTWKSIIIIITFLLTFSTVGYIGFFIALILLIYNYAKIKYLLLIGLILLSSVVFLWNYSGDFKMRIGDSMDVITRKKDLEVVNSSTFALFSNAMVTYKVFSNRPFFGDGLGSRSISYDKHIKSVVNVKKTKILLNREEGNSLFLRILSETGLFGTLAFSYFLFKFHLSKKKDKTDFLWIISNGVLVTILIILIRSGHYFNVGLFFFFWLYYFTWKINQKNNSFRNLEKQSSHFVTKKMTKLQ